MGVSRESRTKFIQVLVLLSLGLALATHASNVGVPARAQHVVASVQPLCGSECSTYYTNYIPGPYCGETFQDTVYRAKVDQATADKQAYSPGDTITVSGTVEVQSYTYYYDSCACYNPNPWVQMDPATASVALELYINYEWTPVSSSVSPDSSGNFVVTYQVPNNQALGTLSFRVTATPSQVGYGNACSPLVTPDQALGVKVVQVSIQTTPPSITLIVTPLSGCAPFTPSMNYTASGGKSPLTVIVYYGDGTSLDVSPGKLWAAHTYNSAGSYTITVKATDANGMTASDSKTISVCAIPVATSSTTSSTQGPVLIPAITVCDPLLTILMMIITIVLTVAIAAFVMRWTARRRPRVALIIAIIVAIIIGFFVGAMTLGGPATVCSPGIVWIVTLVIIVILLIVLREWIIGPLGGGGGVGGGGPPGRLQVRGNATSTQTNGTRLQLTNGNLNQIGPGSSIETQNNSFVRLQTPLGARSETTIGENSIVEWIDQSLKSAFSWLKLPEPAQIYNIERLLLRIDFGKFLLNWIEPAAEKEAVIILPAGLMATGAAEAGRRWLARVKGTMVLVEAARTGTAAAITVLEGDDPTKPSSVELWRSDDLKVIQIQPGERVILTTDQAPTKTTLKLPKGLTWDIEDPFRLLHRYWTVPPMSPETTSILTGTTPKPDETTNQQQTQYCANCGRQIPGGVRFCPYCAAEQPRLP